MIKQLKRYRIFIVATILALLIFLFDRTLGLEALSISAFSLIEIALVIPPIFILLGLLDVWVKKETMVKYMGEKSGVKGIVFAFIIGSVAVGPLYGAFPVAAVFMKKGVKFTNILIFIGAWSTTKIPMFLFEMTSLGSKFALTRLLIDIPGIIILSYIITAIIPKKDITNMYKRAVEL